MPSRIFPELLLAGRERPFWSYLARRQMWDPSALTEDDIDEMVHSVERAAVTDWYARGEDGDDDATRRQGQTASKQWLNIR